MQQDKFEMAVFPDHFFFLRGLVTRLVKAATSVPGILCKHTVHAPALSAFDRMENYIHVYSWSSMAELTCKRSQQDACPDVLLNFSSRFSFLKFMQ